MKKHFIPLAVALTLLLSVLFSGCSVKDLPHSGDGKQAQDFSYAENADGLSLTKYNARNPEPVIPAEIGGKPVTEIAESCFRGSLDITRISIPEGILRIGDYAFECCACLEKIYFPESLVSIGEGAFSGCNHLILADIQNNLQSIGRGAFLYCTSLVSVFLPETLTAVGNFAFAGCDSLTTVLFSGSSLKAIPDRLFYGCASLSRVVLPEGLESVGKRAFSHCTKLENLYFPDEFDTIGDFVFEEDESLVNLTIGMTRIPDNAFARCYGLNYINLSEETVSIGRQAFTGTCVTSLWLPDSVTEIAEGAFSGSQITAVWTGGNPVYTVEDGVLYTDGGKTLLRWFPADPYATEQETAYTVRDGVEIIAAEAFSGAPLETVTLPDTVREVREKAFYESRLTELNAPESTVIDPTATESTPMNPTVCEDEDPADTPAEPQSAPDFIGSLAGESSLFDEEAYKDFLVISNEDYFDWSDRYLEYNAGIGPIDPEHTLYTMLYKGEAITHYMAMTSVYDHDPENYRLSFEIFGDDFEEMYFMMDHGLFTELERYRMCDDLVLYSGVYDSQLIAAAGTDTVPDLATLAASVGREFTDPIMISTTTDIGIACHFSDTLFIIYAPKECIDELGALNIDGYLKTGEREILVNRNARYRILDAGTMEVELHDDEGGTSTVYKNYLKVELLGKAE